MSPNARDAAAVDGNMPLGSRRARVASSDASSCASARARAFSSVARASAARAKTTGSRSASSARTPYVARCTAFGVGAFAST
eukprot:29062-Pelagococcus_subviridis.AAC.3